MMMVMDAEKVQKVGTLAQQLLKHGMAPDIETAMQQAEHMLLRKQDVPLSATTVQHSQPQPAPQQQEFGIPHPHTDYEMMFRGFERKLENAVREYTTQIQDLKATVGALQAQVGQLKMQRPQPTILEKEKTVPQTTLKTEEKKGNPRVGSWEPGDISIEKFFYSGTNPKG